MIAKLLGSPLLFAGICLLHQALTSPRKSRISALSELSQALSFLSRGVNLRTPMPQLLTMRGFGAWADGFFAAVYDGAFQNGEMLGNSWKAAVQTLPLCESEKEELYALGGAFDENAQALEEKLAFCAKVLHTEWKNAQREQKEKQKTEGPVVVCCCLLLIILLV